MRRKIRELSLSGLMVAATSVGLAGTAHASITNDPNTKHYQVVNGRQCLMFDPDLNILEQYQCVNAPSEEFTKISLNDNGSSYYKMLQNYWTGLCMGLPPTPLLGSRIYGMPCDPNNARQYWRFEPTGSDPGVTMIHAALGDNLCLDKDRGNDTQGLPIQVWTCTNPNPKTWETRHDEQIFVDL